MKRTFAVLGVFILCMISVWFFRSGAEVLDTGAGERLENTSATIVKKSKAWQRQKNEPILEELNEVPEFEATIDEDYTMMEADLQSPEIQLARMLAGATANMSDAQMVELQTLRQGTIIRDAYGALNQRYKEQDICVSNAPCRKVIVNTQTNQTVWDGEWSDGFVETGVGKEVIEMKMSTQ